MLAQNRHDKRTLTAAVLLIAIAVVCRFLGIMDFQPKATGLIRSAAYIILFSAWGVSAQSRVIQLRTRRYLIAIASLMVLWFTLRTIKFHFAVTPALIRYLWYLYYLPMLFIPLLAVLAALSIGKPEDYRPSKRAALLYIPTGTLFLLVMTNDLHQLVFTFPDDMPVWTNSGGDYSYGIGYYLVVFWLCVCAMTMLTVLYRKRRIASNRTLILLPCIPIIVLIMYLIVHFSGAAWLRFVLGDMTAVMCLMYMATLEICIRCRFIQGNTHYMELFHASTAGVQITDKEYHVLLSSETAEDIDTQILAKTEHRPVMLENGIRLSSAPIQAGRVVWTEDMSPLLKVLDELEEAKEELESSNGILEEENALKKQKAHIAEQTRLYNIIQRDMARQIRLMGDLIQEAETTESDEERKRLLQKMLVIGAYLKRRSNLVFLADRSSFLDAKEIELAMGESLNNLEICGISCGFHTELTGPVLAAQMTALYDFFENIVERSLDCADSMTVRLGKANHSQFLRINTDASADFSDFASNRVTAERDMDGEWKISLFLREKGDNG